MPYVEVAKDGEGYRFHRLRRKIQLLRGMKITRVDRRCNIACKSVKKEPKFADTCLLEQR